MREARERVTRQLNAERRYYNGSIERERGRMRGMQRDSSTKIEWKAVKSTKVCDGKEINTHGNRNTTDLNRLQVTNPCPGRDEARAATGLERDPVP
jgi:hypothetical protein